MNVPDLYRDGGSSQQVIDLQAAPVTRSDRLDFRFLFTIFQRRIWLFTGIASVIFAGAVLITLTSPPQYKAVARVMLDSRQQIVAPTDNQASAGGATPDAEIDTEVELMRSRTVSKGVVEELGLDKDPRYNPALAPVDNSILGSFKRGIKQQLSRLKPADASRTGSTAEATEAQDDLIDGVLSDLTVARVGTTYTIDIAYSGSDPATVARIANSYAEIYTRFKLNEKVRENQQATTLLSGRIEELRQQAQNDTAAVQQYRIANNLLSTSGASLTEQEISTYNQSVAAARAQAAEEAARLNTARSQLRSGSKGDDVGETLNSSVVQSLKAQRAAISGRVADLQGRYGDRWPDLVKAKAELADIDAQIQVETNRVISNLEARTQVANQRSASLQGSLNSARGTLQQNNRAMVQLDELQRKAQTSQALYESYLERLKQTAAEEGTQRAGARVISTARVPTYPSAPNVPLNLALGLVLAVGAGLVAAFLAEIFTSSLTTADDVEQGLGQPYLGSIPQVTTVEGAGSSAIDSVITNPLSAYAEAFRSLRTSVQYAVAGEAQVVLVTSSLPQEGKTTTSISLARSAALYGQKVVLIDCDVRRHNVVRMLRGQKPAVGLLEVLSGQAPLDAALILDEPSGAMVLPLVGSGRETGELLTGVEMDQLLKVLRQRFDFVILDAAPVLAIAETRVLATKVDAVLFVVRWRKTAEHAVRAAFRLLPRNQVKLAGVALTRVDMRKQSRYGYGDPGYYYKQYKSYYS